MKGTKLLQQTALYLKRNSSTVLTCVGVVGVVATAISAAKATPKAIYILNELEVKNRDSLTGFEKIRAVWPLYIPTVMIGSATIACLIGANVLNQRQQAALTSAYIFLDQSFKDYKQKVAELYGDDANSNIRAAIAKAKYSDVDIQPKGDETLLFFEEHYGQYFERSMLQVMDAEYLLNRKFAMEGEVSLNDFFEFLGLSEMEIGDVLGWSQEMICDYPNPAWIDFEHQLVRMDDGMECYIINMLVTPKAGYDCPF